MSNEPSASSPSGSPEFTNRGPRDGMEDRSPYADAESHSPVDGAAHDDHGGVEEFLENQLRSRPVATLLAAVAAGWVVGKIVR